MNFIFEMIRKVLSLGGKLRVWLAPAKNLDVFRYQNLWNRLSIGRKN